MFSIEFGPRWMLITKGLLSYKTEEFACHHDVSCSYKWAVWSCTRDFFYQTISPSYIFFPGNEESNLAFMLIFLQGVSISTQVHRVVY